MFWYIQVDKLTPKPCLHPSSSAHVNASSKRRANPVCLCLLQQKNNRKPMESDEEAGLFDGFAFQLNDGTARNAGCKAINLSQPQ